MKELNERIIEKEILLERKKLKAAMRRSKTHRSSVVKKKEIQRIILEGENKLLGDFPNPKKMISQICRNVSNSAFKHYSWMDVQKKMFKRQSTREEEFSKKILNEFKGFNSEALLVMEKEIEDDLKHHIRMKVFEDKIRNRREFVKEVAERLKKFGGIKSVDHFVKETLEEEEIMKIQAMFNRNY